jgi:hypothetical protein
MFLIMAHLQCRKYARSSKALLDLIKLLLDDTRVLVSCRVIL